MSSPLEDEKTTRPVIVTAQDFERIDSMSEVLERMTGGFFSKGRVVSRALDALARELEPQSTHPSPLPSTAAAPNF